MRKVVERIFWDFELFLRSVLLDWINWLRVGLCFLAPSDDELRFFDEARGVVNKNANSKVGWSKGEIIKITRNIFFLFFKVSARLALNRFSPQVLVNLKDPKIITPPGGRILAIADFFCSPKTMELTVKPTLADWHEEYFAALSQRRAWKARFISVRYYFRFMKIFGLKKLVGMLKAFSTAG